MMILVSSKYLPLIYIYLFTAALNHLLHLDKVLSLYHACKPMPANRTNCFPGVPLSIAARKFCRNSKTWRCISSGNTNICSTTVGITDSLISISPLTFAHLALGYTTQYRKNPVLYLANRPE